MIIKLLSLVTIFSAMSMISITSITTAQTTINEESRTFMDCYSSFASGFLLASLVTPTTIDLLDPEVKNFMANMCNFYHEKTGKWIDPNNQNDITYEINSEFYQTYEIPQSIEQAMDEHEQITN